MKDGDVMLLENTRFHAGEEKNDPAFATALAKLGDVYVNDAFSAAHRAHASTEGLAHLLPSAAGRAMQAELATLHRALDKPEHPVMAVVGGAKISTKLEVLKHLGRERRRAGDRRRDGEHVPCRPGLPGRQVAGASSISARLHEKSSRLKVVLPSDVVVAQEFKPNAPIAHHRCPATSTRRDDPRRRPAHDLRLRAAA